MSSIEWNDDIKELCTSKAEELQLLGYEHVKAKEVWSCVSSRYAKSGQPQLHQLVNDILSLRATQFMNYLMLSAYKGDSFE
ncbi:MAG: post-transcriptional regulator [Candidatus Pristimantibacillus lignocellulolyticus]|uniref:Post-transcriptional regulator n=1 Tax=Candidatus Pristimantibacillus lignocellulolyticus TaxID=2994561 RepID=A0A9J6Z9Q8_9BACL|nr:MAG: post-transcriptional regulator [Candidatus Pristimantibacillus lignocellulolyticus]